MSKDAVVEDQRVWGLLVHGVVAPVTFKERSEAVSAIKAWKSRGWEFVSVINLEEAE